MKGTTNAQRNAIIDSTSAVDSLTLTKADGTTQKHTVSSIIPKDDAPTSGSSKFVTSGAIYTALDGKVSVVSGKGLSTNDYTTAEKSKVSNLPANANTTFATKTELTDALSSVYKYKGSVNTYDNLPSNATAGDVYNVVASHDGVPAGTNWAWNGSSWDALGGTVTGYVADTTTVNGKPLSSNVTLTAADVSAVPTTRTVNGKALSSDITLAASDVGALASGGTAARATADASGNVITSTYATKSALETGLAGKQNSLTFDSAPTSGSSNPVTSGGVYSAINTVNSAVSAKQDKLTFDTTPESGSSNPITSGGVYTAINGCSSKIPMEYYGPVLDNGFFNHSITLEEPIDLNITKSISYSLNLAIYSTNATYGLYFDPGTELVKLCVSNSISGSDGQAISHVSYLNLTSDIASILQDKLSFLIGKLIYTGASPCSVSSIEISLNGRYTLVLVTSTEELDGYTCRIKSIRPATIYCMRSQWSSTADYLTGTFDTQVFRIKSTYTSSSHPIPVTNVPVSIPYTYKTL